MTLTRNTNLLQYCDYCKARFGTLKTGELHPRAKVPAYWKCESQHPSRRGQVRFYCLECAKDLQNWPDGTFYSLKEQLEDALKTTAKQEKLDVELPR